MSSFEGLPLGGGAPASGRACFVDARQWLFLEDLLAGRALDLLRALDFKRILWIFLMLSTRLRRRRRSTGFEVLFAEFHFFEVVDEVLIVAFASLRPFFCGPLARAHVGRHRPAQVQRSHQVLDGVAGLLSRLLVDRVHIGQVPASRGGPMVAHGLELEQALLARLDLRRFR